MERSQAFAAVAAAVADKPAAASLTIGAEMRHIQLFLRDGIAPAVYQIKVHPVEKIHIAVLTALAALDAAVSRIPDIVQDDHLPLKHRAPLVSDADVVTDDFAAERCGRCCCVQRLAAVKRDGQVGADGTFGHLAGVGVDAAGQVYRQNKCAFSC